MRGPGSVRKGGPWLWCDEVGPENDAACNFDCTVPGWVCLPCFDGVRASGSTGVVDGWTVFASEFLQETSPGRYLEEAAFAAGASCNSLPMIVGGELM